MEQQVKTIRIKEGKPWASPMVGVSMDGVTTATQVKTLYDLFDASFVEVENPITFYVNLALYISNGNIIEKGLASKIDGDYPAPEGLTMEVKHLCPNEDSFCEVCNCKQVATVKFTPAEKEEKPDLITKWKNVIDMGASSYSWSVIAEMFNDFQQEITTLRARIAELETAKSGQKQG